MMRITSKPLSGVCVSNHHQPHKSHVFKEKECLRFFAAAPGMAKKKAVAARHDTDLSLLGIQNGEKTNCWNGQKGTVYHLK